MNPLQIIKDELTLSDNELAARIEAKTGKRYHPVYLYQVRKGIATYNDTINDRLRDTFPSFFSEWDKKLTETVS